MLSIITMTSVLPSTPAGRKSFKSLKHLIRTQIQQGELLPHQRLASMRDMAEQYEMSLATVQRAIVELCDESVLYSQKGRGTFVSPLRRELRTIGVLSGIAIDTLESSMFGSQMKAFQSAAMRAGKNLTLFQIRKRHKGQYNYVDVQDIIRHDVDALVLVNVLNLGLIASLKQLGMPVVATDLDATDVGVHSLYFDNEASAFDMTTKFIQAGHKTLWFIGGATQEHPEYDLCYRQRYSGFRLACRATGIDPGPEFIHSKHTTSGSKSQQIKDALNSLPKPTAIVCEPNDSVVEVLKEENLTDIKIGTWCPKESIGKHKTHSSYMAPVDFTQLGGATYDLLERIFSDTPKPLEKTIIDCPVIPGDIAPQ